MSATTSTPGVADDNDGTFPDDEPGDYVVTVSNAPPTIWLNVGDIDSDCAFEDLDSDHDGVTWSCASMYPADIRYVRADLVEAVLPTNWREDPDWLALAKAAGIE